MARSRSVAVVDARAELAEVEGRYRHELTKPVELPEYRWKPVLIGPTWQTEVAAGRRRWVLPERTLGWQMLAWCGRWLQLTRGERGGSPWSRPGPLGRAG